MVYLILVKLKHGKSEALTSLSTEDSGSDDITLVELTRSSKSQRSAAQVNSCLFVVILIGLNRSVTVFKQQFSADFGVMGITLKTVNLEYTIWLSRFNQMDFC